MGNPRISQHFTMESQAPGPHDGPQVVQHVLLGQKAMAVMGYRGCQGMSWLCDAVRLVPGPGTDVGYANEGDQQSRPGHRDCMGCCCLGGSLAHIFPYCTTSIISDPRLTCLFCAQDQFEASGSQNKRSWPGFFYIQ